MAGLLSYVPIVNRFISTEQTSEPRRIDLPAVEIHHVETNPDRRARCLKHLLKANHANYAVIYHNLQFDNHNPHILCSAYLLGANEPQLRAIYDEEARSLDPWTESPCEIIEDDWREYLGDKRYQRAYLDFFEDNLVMQFSYDWKKLVAKYLFSGDGPLVHGLIGGLGHPLIHLGYAFEMDCKEIAVEALTLAATQYNFFHKYLDDPSYTKPSPFASNSPRKLLTMLRDDERFNGLFRGPGFDNIDALFRDHEALVLEYWNAWAIEDPLKQFQESQEVAVDLLVATVPLGTHAYNFFIVHLLTTSHAVRIVLPSLPAKFHIPIVREWWLLTLAVYIAMLRPEVDPDNVDPGDVKHKKWNYVVDKALNSPWSTDAHFVKAIRSMMEAARTWGDVQERYLAAALTFVNNFNGWVH